MRSRHASLTRSLLCLAVCRHHGQQLPLPSSPRSRSPHVHRSHQHAVAATAAAAESRALAAADAAAAASTRSLTRVAAAQAERSAATAGAGPSGLEPNEAQEPEPEGQAEEQSKPEEEEEAEDEVTKDMANWISQCINAKHASSASSAAAAASSSSSSFLKPRPAASSSSSSSAAAAAASSSSSGRVGVASSTNLDTQFTPRAAGGGIAASDAAAVPHGFIQRGGVLHLSSSAQAAATASDSAQHPSNVVAPDLLAKLGGKSSALPSTNPLQANKAAKAASGAQPNAGRDWFDLSRPLVITPEVKVDLKMLSLRAYLGQRTFFKKSNGMKKIVPTFFQMGTVVAGAQDFYSSRLSHAQRSDHYADEFIDASKNVGAVKKTKNYLKRKVMELQAANAPAPKTGNKKQKIMQEASKRPGHRASGKKKH